MPQTDQTGTLPPATPPVPAERPHALAGRILGIGMAVAALVTLGLVVAQTDLHPRTDDASVRANYIEIAPEVSGRLVDLPIRDNEYIKQGDPLFLIDPRPYEYALKQALSDQDDLEQQIIDARRHIAAQASAAQAARATLVSSQTGIQTAGSTVDVASATVSRAKASVEAADAQLKLATNNLHRIEPLLKKQYVTVEQIDQANTTVRVAQGSYDEAVAALNVAQAQQQQASHRKVEASAQANESEARLGQAIHAIDTVDTLVSQRPSKAAKVDSARLDLERTKVVAPFNAYVTNMNISQGAYARPGQAMFTLIDTRTWYVIANYRESKLKNIHLNDHVDVFVMGHPDRRFNGIVESIGYGVFPEDGAVAGGLPNIDRTLNWVHLSSRFPVRIRVNDPDPELFRIGATAVTVVR
ncbi:efflux RND transporter periplasmic adaptor subunit [Granulicella tundricola]|uniref:Secretion protein HlyD family protein n=1 Tax=Granulicella tundricola (strain ATCC BAA-1859 / DSM 23138 / MP5ACTX9) TaxID=1198114 RepID=E8WX22_GRATM|nr:biotin/lipoyl-binding protein [Granulicella tundricola]ADW68583.1 secretion protein HlyD family protein [Granulicella tundricola MP5ACTX9]